MKTTVAGIMVIGLASVCLFSSGVSARDIHVSPTGKSDGDGSREHPLDVKTALSAQSPAQPGDVILLAGGTYDGPMDGIKRIPFDLSVSGAKEKPIRIMPEPGQSAHLNGTVLLKSSFAHYINLEIGDLDWDPWGEKHKADTALNATGGEGAKVINCNIFGGSMGSGLWSSARDLEIYGCLVHDFGYLEKAGRGHGHAFYAQNETGNKVLENNIAYRGCGWNLHVYTQAGQINGFDVIGNIMYIAGAAKEGQTMDNYLVSGYPPADRIRLIGNLGYQPTDVEGWRPNARLSNFKPALNGSGEIRDNTFMGAFYGLSLGNWRSLKMFGNRIWATGIHVEISSAPTGSGIGELPQKPDLSGYEIDGNTYIENGRPRTFYYGSAERFDDKKKTNLLSFAEWQGLGLDKNGKWEPGREGKPAGVQTFIFTNRYDAARIHVGIFNWDGKPAADVDLSPALVKGQMYVVYNCLDIRQTIRRAKPVLSGAFDGKPIAFPMRKDPIAPNFEAFLVLGIK